MGRTTGVDSDQYLGPFTGVPGSGLPDRLVRGRSVPRTPLTGTRVPSSGPTIGKRRRCGPVCCWTGGTPVLDLFGSRMAQRPRTEVDDKDLNVSFPTLDSLSSPYSGGFGGPVREESDLGSGPWTGVESLKSLEEEEVKVPNFGQPAARKTGSSVCRFQVLRLKLL